MKFVVIYGKMAQRGERMLCSRLIQFREYNGLSPEQIAEAIGVGLDIYRDYENNAAVPDIDTVKKLAAIYKVTVDEFYGYTPRITLHSNEHDKPLYDDKADESLLKLANLSWDEQCIILKYRSLENKEEIYNIINDINGK